MFHGPTCPTLDGQLTEPHLTAKYKSRLREVKLTPWSDSADPLRHRRVFSLSDTKPLKGLLMLFKT